MSFLTRSSGMTKREAAQIVELHELVQHSLANGPVPLEIYVKIRRVDSVKVEHQERNARRLVALLRSLGFIVKTEGDAEKLALDFSADEALRSEIEKSVDRALARSNGVVHSHDEDEPDATDALPADQILRDHQLGLTVSRLARRYGIGEHHTLALLRAIGCEARAARPLRIEERRCAETMAHALSLPRGYGRVAQVARVLGCHRNTARRVLARLARLKSDRDGHGHNA